MLENDHRPGLAGLGSCWAVLSVELDTTAPGVGTTPPPPLSRERAAEVGEAVAADLERLLGGIEHLSLIMPGALYDQTELLRPGFPLMGALEDVFRGTLRDGVFTPQLVCLGSDGRPFTLPALNPERRPGSGPLLLLPFILGGRVEDTAPLARTLEETLLERGVVAPRTRAVVESAFALRATHLSFVTVADLLGLLQVQLETSGFAPLWSLLEHVHLGRPGHHAVTLSSGNRFVVQGREVHTLFHTFDDWAAFGPGRELAGEDLAAGYGDWIRQHRQYTLGLEAHGLSVHLVRARPELESGDSDAIARALRRAPALAGETLVEPVVRQDGPGAAARVLITDQADPDTGTVALTAVEVDTGGRALAMAHHYPLRPGALDSILASLRARYAESALLRPGQLVRDDSGRRLTGALP